MTIVRNDAADSFVQRPPREIRFFLLHGIDEGLIHERAKTLGGAVVDHDRDPLRVTRIDRDALAREPGRLADEVYAISMFGGHRAVWIEASGRDLAPLFEPLLRRPPQDCTVIVEAGNLPKGSPLRVAFETAANAVAVECYPDDRRALVSLIDAEAQRAGLNVSRDAREYLLALLGSDRLTTRSEVVKLMLYAAGAATIEVEDVEAIVADAAPSGLDALIDHALLGDFTGVERASFRFFADGGDAEVVIMRLVSRMGLLHRIRLEMETGKGFEAALQGQFLPPAARAALARQAERWNSGALGKRLPAIRAVAARARRDPRLARAAAMRALWALARSPGNR
jgi:DNA polymerase III subunit delta